MPHARFFLPEEPTDATERNRRVTNPPSTKSATTENPATNGGVPVAPTKATEASISRPLVTRRKYRQHRERATEWRHAGQYDHAGQVLATIEPGTERVFLVGPKPGLTKAGVRAWAMDGLPAGWSHARAGHYLEGEHPTLRYERPDGRRVELLRVASYFGEGDYSVRDAQAGWVLLGEEIGRAFPNARLLATPATTGRELLLRSIPHGVEWPVLPAGVQAVIRSHSGQGRIQLLHRERQELPELAVYDGRFMYAALCWGLPAGIPTRDSGDEFLGQTRARYFVEFRVPDDWHRACECKSAGHEGLGILPVKNTESRDGWQYPCEPGASGEGWYDGAELLVALRHGWPVRIRQRLIFPSYTTAGPLDGWSKRLIGVRQSIEAELAEGTYSTTAIRLARAGVRAIVLHAIGSLHGTPHRVTRMAPIDGGQVPRDAENLRVDGDHYVWAESRATAWAEMSHPEWSAAIWARARARLLSGPGGTGALHVPAGDVLAFRTDAVYLTRRTDWPDDGKPGRLRLTKWREGPMPAPRSHADLLRLREGK